MKKREIKKHNFIKGWKETIKFGKGRKKSAKRNKQWKGRGVKKAEKDNERRIKNWDRKGRKGRGVKRRREG
jgi:hypothetical protein